MLDESFREIALMVSEAVGGPYHVATLNYPGVPVIDAGGDIVDPGAPSKINCHAQVDVVTEEMRADADFQGRDVRLLILGPASLDAVPTLTVSGGPFNGQTYSIRSVTRDVLGFAWECRGRGL